MNSKTNAHLLNQTLLLANASISEKRLHRYRHRQKPLPADDLGCDGHRHTASQL